jgi:hypothetical protein
MLLTDQEVRSLTGAAQKAAQIAWLRRNGWRFTVNALGRAKVAIAEFNRHMVGGRSQKQEPDFSHLNG